MKEKLVFEVKRTIILKRNGERNKKRSGNRTEKERGRNEKHHLLKRNEAGIKTSFIEKERDRNEIVNLEEQPIPFHLSIFVTKKIPISSTVFVQK